MQILLLFPCDESTGFKITPEMLEEKITSKTKAVIINSPNNPTGAVYSYEELRSLGETLSKSDIYIVTDEIYDRLIYDEKHYSINAICPELNSRTILVNGHSKVFAMTGWRLGYIAAPTLIAKSLTTLQSHSAGNACTIAQEAGIEAFSSFPNYMLEEFNERRQILISGLKKIPGIYCSMPGGAFYAFPNISELLQKSYHGELIGNVERFCELLLEEQLLSTIPGSAFSSSSNLRMSYALSREEIYKALHRLEEFVTKLN
ncbi:aminotransferase class I/II-fold pyridoxal phosphate-dependent enzyme [Virgibacillus sp. DJP39]|uniref:aminotransferase class I/II-fold pyridoxal phosphate-dependent enzyme n=1 Tax=Virgibacillus sp. DJP39 TaxID=3409790 RepID=UPI003BB5DC41